VKLLCYRASGEAAMLIPSSECQRHRIRVPSDIWQQIRDDNVDLNQDNNIHIVTDIWTTNRWAMDYRSSAVEHDHYVVNVQNIWGSLQIPTDFTVCTTSPTLRRTEDVYPSYPPTQYTIFAKYLASASTPLKQPQWRQRVS
jgi:hypothetical protein